MGRLAKRLRWLLGLGALVSLVYIGNVYKPLLGTLAGPPGGGSSLPVAEGVDLAARVRAERAEQAARTFAAELRSADSTDLAAGRPQLQLLIEQWLRKAAQAEGSPPPGVELLTRQSDSLAGLWLAH